VHIEDQRDRDPIGPVFAAANSSRASRSEKHIEGTGGRLAEAVSPCLVQQLYRGRLGSDLLARRFAVQAVPTLLILRDGAVVTRRSGAAPAGALRHWIDAAL
jgi:hypothetical protein